jgi:hypothetical protein
VNEGLFGKTTEPKTLEQADAISTQSRGIALSAQRRLRMLALEGAAR